MPRDRAPAWIQGPLTAARLVALNVRRYRLRGHLDQSDLAERMKLLGHAWKRATVGGVERAERRVTPDELMALSLVLGVQPQLLLNPGGDVEDAVVFGGRHHLPAVVVRHWFRGEVVLRVSPSRDGARPVLYVEPVEGHAQAFERCKQLLDEIERGSG